MYVDTGPGLKIEESHIVEMEGYGDASNSSVGMADCNGTLKDGSLPLDKDVEQLALSGDRVEFPDWASNLASIVWIPIRAISETLARGSSSGCECDANFWLCFYNVCPMCICFLLNPIAYQCMMHHVLLQWLPKDRAIWME